MRPAQRITAGLALVLTGALGFHLGRARSLSVASIGFLVGTLVFSGSLWLLVLTNTRWLGAITPLGGLSLMAGWIALAVAGFGAPAGPDGREGPLELR